MRVGVPVFSGIRSRQKLYPIILRLVVVGRITLLGGSGQGRYGDRPDEYYASNRAHKHKPNKLNEPDKLK